MSRWRITKGRNAWPWAAVTVSTALVTWMYALPAQAAREDWQISLGASFFKWSAGRPNEIGYNAVADRWERIEQDPSQYAVAEYQALQPLFFNMSFGVNAFIRYRRYLLLQIAYDYSNPMGFGGIGHITYTDRSTGITTTESKEFGFSSHQLSYYIGPIVPIGSADIYLGFTPMGPTWVRYHEQYTRTDNGALQRSYERNWSGFFGNCRAVIGIQVPLLARLKLGSEATFVFMNNITLRSGNIQDNSFAFPGMRWTFTVRYDLL